MKTISCLLVVALLAMSSPAISLPPRGPSVVSPRVNAEKMVTFRYLAPLAKDVKLSGQFLKAPMDTTKDSIGIWSVTAGPVAPDMYPYSFRVDGVTVS